MSQFSRALLFCAALVCVLQASSLAQAQTGTVRGYNLQNYNPGVDGFSIWSTNTTQMLAPGKSFVELGGNISGGQLSIVADGQPTKLLDKLLTTNLVYSLGITDFVSTGIDVSFHPWAKGTVLEFADPDLTEDEFEYEPKSTWAMGDMRFFTKWRIIKDAPNTWVPGIGLLLYATLPSGEENRFVGWQSPTLGGDLIIDKSFKFLNLAINVGYQSIPETFSVGLNIDDRLNYSAGVAVPARPFKNTELALITEVAGSYQLQNAMVAFSPLEFHSGVRTKFNNGFGFTVGGGTSLNNAIGNPDYRGFLSVFWNQPSSKSQPQIATSSIESSLPDVTTQAQEPVIILNQSPDQTIAIQTLPERIPESSAPTLVLPLPESSELARKLSRAEPNTSNNSILLTTLYFKNQALRLDSYQSRYLDETSSQFLADSNLDKIIIELTQQSANNQDPEFSDRQYRRATLIRQHLQRKGIDPRRILIRTLNHEAYQYHASYDRVNILVTKQNLIATPAPVSKLDSSKENELVKEDETPLPAPLTLEELEAQFLPETPSPSTNALESKNSNH